MGYEIKLTPEELFFLGEAMNADHLDYSYIAMMRDIEKNYAQISDKNFRELANKRIIRKKLRGDISIVPEVEALLKNVFEGSRSAALEVYHQADEVTREEYRFHFGNDSITEVIVENGYLIVKACTADNISAIIRDNTDKVYAGGKQLSAIVPDDIQTLISAVSSDLGAGGREKEVYEIGNALYTADDGNNIRSLTSSEAFDLLDKVMRGEE